MGVDGADNEDREREMVTIRPGDHTDMIMTK